MTLNVLPVLIFGLGAYLTIWSGLVNRGVPNPPGIGEWTSAPRFLRPILRRSEGPILVGSVAVEGMSAILVAAALLHFGGFIDAAAAENVMASSMALPVVVWLYLWLRSRTRHR